MNSSRMCVRIVLLLSVILCGVGVVDGVEVVLADLFIKMSPSGPDDADHLPRGFMGATHEFGIPVRGYGGPDSNRAVSRQLNP